MIPSHARKVAGAGIVDGAGHQLLARTGFTGNEHRGAAGRSALNHQQNVPYGPAAAHNLVDAVAVFHNFLQQPVLAVRP